jgi:hypothetical protein
VYVVDMEITKSAGTRHHPCAVFSIRLPRKISHQDLMAKVAKINGVVSVEEL